MMESLIQTGDELKEWFFSTRKKHNANKLHSKGIYVNTKVRKEILTGINQGYFILEGKIEEIKFEALGGGVYRAFIEKEK